MNNTAETIGFIGVGLMGHGIAKNLLAAGYPVYVLAHRNRAPVEDLLSKGAKFQKRKRIQATPSLRTSYE